MACMEFRDHVGEVALFEGERSRCDGGEGSFDGSGKRGGELGAGLSSSETLKALIIKSVSTRSQWVGDDGRQRDQR